MNDLWMFGTGIVVGIAVGVVLLMLIVEDRDHQ